MYTILFISPCRKFFLFLDAQKTLVISWCTNTSSCKFVNIYLLVTCYFKWDFVPIPQIFVKVQNRKEFQIKNLKTDCQNVFVNLTFIVWGWNKKVSKALEDIKAITHDARGNSTAKKETTLKTYSLTHLIFLQPQFEACKFYTWKCIPQITHGAVSRGNSIAKEANNFSKLIL